MTETKYFGKKFENPNSAPPQKRRICITSEPVTFIKTPTRIKKAVLTSSLDKPDYENHKVLSNSKKMYPKFCNLVGGADNFKYDYNPDIYIDDKDEECFTTVRRTCSKIKWAKPIKKSKYHKKCAEKENYIKPKFKPKPKRRTLISDSDIEDILISEENERQKFYNECYCTDSEYVQTEEELKKPVKPLIISDDRKEQYGYNTIKNTHKLIDYNPDSEFLKRLRKYVNEGTNYDCQCRDCILEKLEKSLKYTNRRALIEKAYYDIPKPEPYKPKKQNIKVNTDITCRNKEFLCKVPNNKEVGFNTDAINTKEKGCCCQLPQYREYGGNTDKLSCSSKACSCHMCKYHDFSHNTDEIDKLNKSCSCQIAQRCEFGETAKPCVNEKSCACHIPKYHECSQNTEKANLTEKYHSCAIPQFHSVGCNSEMPSRCDKACMCQNYKDSLTTEKIRKSAKLCSCKTTKIKQVNTKAHNTKSRNKHTITKTHTVFDNNTQTCIEKPENITYKETGTNCMCRIHSASLIRNKNFFDTHSVSDLQKKIRPHQCVHKFKLDDRLLPKPINTDSWGQSRCEICYKPYESSTEKYDKEFQTPSKLNLCDKAVSPRQSSNFCLPTQIKSSPRHSSNFCLPTQIKSSPRQSSNFCLPTKIKSSPRQLSNFCLPKQIKSSDSDIHKVPSYKCSSATTSSDHQPKSKSTQFEPIKMSPLKLTAYKSTNTSKTTLSAPKLSSACRQISVGDNKTILELDRNSSLQENMFLSSSQFFDKCKKIKIRANVQPNNSLALRYQKGVL